ncbi:MAG: InlB B-repeat-containing protein [Bacilli bacterium]|nr:InlB B-repeat-containing protein [Bacilli bacterium]
MKSGGKTVNFWILLLFSAAFLILLLVKNNSYANPLDNDVEVELNSELIYYLNVQYDGIDKNGIKSNDSTIAQINSDILFVEDKLPEGLEFEGFIATGNGSIGAVKRSDNSVCVGKVIDDTNEESINTGRWNSDHTEYTYHGLHYNLSNRTVTFKVENLMAGCYLTVGIKTKTPSTVDDPITPELEKRRDFYNFATSRERGLTVNSNTVHAFMGSDDIALYSVKYEYSGIVPSNAPSLPQEMNYAANSIVNVAANVEVEGYTFSGWSTSDVSVNNNSFKMPETNVTLRGSFTRKNTNKVSYLVEGVTPGDYVIPLEKNYYPGSVVSVDILKEGDVFNGYRFLGWNATDVEVSEDLDFVMPDHDVSFTGRFEEVKYKVTYQFYDGVLPPNSDSYLPDTKDYSPGEKVTLESVKSEPDGYSFLGWYKEKEFEMPNSDVTIYGEWKLKSGEFRPEIKIEIIDPKKSYKEGDTVEFRIIIKNTENYPIKDVIVKELNDGVIFTDGKGYEVVSDHIVNIDRLDPNESIELYSNYKVTNEKDGVIENKVEIKGALADNNYEMAKGDYSDSIEFKIKQDLIVPADNTGIRKYLVPLVLAIILIVSGMSLVLITKQKKEKV